jgi:hypothetical protein
MGLSTYVYAIREQDEKHKKMFAAAKACRLADVPFPKELEQYFPDGFDPDDESCGLTVRLPVKEKTTRSTCWDVDLATLPKGTKKVRFENSF